MNWLVLDEELKTAWESEASRRVAELLGTAVQVNVSLPSKEDARVAWNENRDLRGRLSFALDGREVATSVALPYRGVFVARSRSNGHAQALTWNSWLGENPGIRLVRSIDSSGDDTAHCRFRFAKKDGRYVDVGGLRKARDRECTEYWHKAGEYEINLKPKADVPCAQSLRLDERDIPDVPREIVERLLRFYQVVDACMAKKPSEDYREIAAAELLAVLEAHLKYAAEHDLKVTSLDHEDLAHRQFMSFPRWLLETLCQRIVQLDHMVCVEKGEKTRAQVFTDETVASLVPVGILAKTSDKLSPCLLRVQPKNAVELCARITSVRRRRMSGKTVERLSEIHRQNHASFDGRICPIETPESEQVGLTLQLAKGATVSADGQIVAAVTGGAQERIAWGTGLIPFANCNDGARNMMGAKNLRQALPIKGRTAPCVKTGVERQIKEYVSDFVDLGICPDCGDRDGAFALGKDLLVAYMPWYGWNVDDAVVVCRNVVKDFSVVARKHFRQEIGPEWRCASQMQEGQELTNGALVVRLVDNRGREFLIRYLDPTPAVLEKIVITPPLEGSNAFAATVEYEISKEIPLGVGDKIMGRHGNKGVVALVLDEKDMPHLPDALGGGAVDIILNPHGVLSRKNPAQLLETHLGWLFHKGIDESRVKVAEKAHLQIGAPEVGVIDHQKVRELLREKGLDGNGRVRLTLPGNAGETEDPVVVGYEHIVRLCHIPEMKSQARRGGRRSSYSESTGQAVRGRKLGGGQRLGEMEVWALAAQGADALLEEMLGGKSDGEWARCWETDVALPIGASDQGFPTVLKAWLLALGVKTERDGGQLKFSLVKGVDDFLGFKPEAKELNGSEGYVTVRKAAFRCKKCGRGPQGVYTFGENANTKGLSLSSFLQEKGYEITGALERIDGCRCAFPVGKNGVSGKLDVEFVDYGDQKDWLKARVTPSETEAPVDWPKGSDILTCYLQLCMRKEEQSAVCGEFPQWKSKNMPACVLLQMFMQEGGTRSVGDMMLTCKDGHYTTTLRPVEPYGESMVAVEGGLFDPELFGDHKWGYIELPVEIPHPFANGHALQVIPVLPLSYRRPSDATGWVVDEHDLSKLYRDVLAARDGFDGCDEKTKDKLQAAVENLMLEIRRRMNDKHGIVRRNGLGRRVDRSARAVIVPNPTLRWNQAGLSANLLWEMMGDACSHVHFDPSLVKGEKEREQSAGWAYRRSGDAPSSMRQDIQSRLEQDQDLLIVLNRQPSLHRDSMQAFRPQLTDGEGAHDVIQLSPLACKGFAADFDGDEMVAHYPVSDAARKDAKKMMPDSRLTSGATGECMANFDRDFVSGLELLYEQARADAGETALRALLKDACCRDILAQDFARDKKQCFGTEILGHICKMHPERAVELISELAKISFEACTRRGISYGFYDVMDYREKKCPSIGLITESGANGAKQLGMDVDLTTGMAWEEMFRRSYSARSVMCQKKLGASKSGGLTRQLVLALWPWTIVCDDCGAPKHSIADCQCKHGVCARCYGSKEVYGENAGKLTDGTPIVIGAPVGLLAAQSLGERGTQLTMQAIHGVNGELGFDLKTARRLLLSGGGEAEKAEYFNAGPSDSVEHSGREYVERFVERLTKEKAYAEIDRRHIEMVWRALETAGASHKLVDLISGDEDAARRIASKEQAERFVALAAANGVMSLDSPFARVMGNLYGQRELKEEA